MRPVARHVIRATPPPLLTRHTAILEAEIMANSLSGASSVVDGTLAPAMRSELRIAAESPFWLNNL